MQMEIARAKKTSKEMKCVARYEGLAVNKIRSGIAQGKIIIISNPLNSKVNPVGIGKGLRTKINANIGTSSECSSIKEELKKLKTAIKNGADAVMDLSTGGDLQKTRRLILRESSVPIGTVPIYEAVVNTINKKRSIIKLTPDEIFDCIEKHAKDGVSFVTVHCGITLEGLKKIKGRLTGIVSRGGAFLACWMAYNKRENPLYEQFDRLLKIAKKYDLVLSLGDGFRPGSIADATDSAQMHELKTLGMLAERAWKENVQVMIEGPGHIPLHEIKKNVFLEKKICKGAPFYVLGPLVTDVAPGYDHITSAIGGAIAGSAGADFLCYVTPSEHLALPSLNDVKEGVIASRIAAHAADIAKGVKNALKWDFRMSKARVDLDWKKQEKYAIDPEKIKISRIKKIKTCTMCGKFCAMDLIKKKFY